MVTNVISFWCSSVLECLKNHAVTFRVLKQECICNVPISNLMARGFFRLIMENVNGDTLGIHPNVLSEPEVDESFSYANGVVIAGLDKLNGYSSVRHFVTFDQQVKRPRYARRDNIVCPFLA